MAGFLERSISNQVLANLVIVSFLACGIISAMSIRRESMPNVSIPGVEVEVVWPGADPIEVEEAIARRLESAIDGIEGVKDYSTTSLEGAGFVRVEFTESESFDRMLDRVRNAVDSIPSFPDDIERPRYHEYTIDDNDVLNVVLWGQSSERQLKSWAESTRDEIQRLPGVSLVEILDTRRYEIDVQVSKERLQQYGISLAEVSRAIEEASSNLSAGSIHAEGEEIRIRTVGRRETGPEFSNVVVKALPSGEVITLDGVADIHDGFSERGGRSSFNGQPAVALDIMKAPGEDALAIADSVQEYVRSKQASLPEGMHMTPFDDESDFVRGQLSLLTRNGLIGLALVLITLFLFLTTRLAFWVAMGIPISLAGSFIVMYLTGITLNQISLVTFIIVLGIIVDDAIVVGEAIFHQRRMGKAPLRAAVDGVREVGMPIIAAVSTTAIAFLPIAFIPGIMGSIMFLLPIIVISALITSLFESLVLLPAHLSDLPDLSKPSKHTDRLSRLRRRLSTALEHFAEHRYYAFANHAIRHRYVSLSIAIALCMITIGVIGGGFVRVVFWPSGDGDFMAATIEFPDGTPADVTAHAVDQLREALERVSDRTETKNGKPLLRNVHTRVYPSRPHQGQVVAEIVLPSQRNISQEALTVAWEKETPAIPGAITTEFEKTSMGMDGPAVEVWLQAKDMDVLRQASLQLQDKLRSYAGVYQVADDFRPGKTEIQVRLKPGAHHLGLNLEDVANQLRGGYYGHEAVRMQRGREEMKVRVRLPEEERSALADLDRLRIKTPDGHEVPFHSVADIEMAQGYSVIRGVNGLRNIAVTAEVDSSANSPHEVLAALESKYLDTLTAQYPGLEWSVEGVAESNQETVGGLQRGFALALLGIFAIMAAIFRSYAQPLIILTVIPFGIIGAVVGHGLVGIPITFLSLFGIIAMAGVVVNDGIVLVECVNSHIARGVSFYESLAKGGVRRFRAIFLTSVSTCAGLTPIILEKDLQAQVVIPMAVSIAGGVAFATILNLVFVPCLLAIMNDGRRLKARIFTGQWPTPEEVEPASQRDPDAFDAHTPHEDLTPAIT